MAAFAERNAFQFGVGFLKVGNRRYETRIQAVYGNSVFQTGTHGVARKTFGIADNYLAYIRPEGGFKRIGFRTGRAAARRRVGFVRDKHQLFGNIRTRNTALAFAFANQVVHYLCHMAHIQAGDVETAVADFGRQHFGQRFHTAFGHFAGFFHHQRDRTHTHNHTVAAAVKRQGGFRHVGFRSSGAGG